MKMHLPWDMDHVVSITHITAELTCLPVVAILASILSIPPVWDTVWEDCKYVSSKGGNLVWLTVGTAAGAWLASHGLRGLMWSSTRWDIGTEVLQVGTAWRAWWVKNTPEKRGHYIVHLFFRTMLYFFLSQTMLCAIMSLARVVHFVLL